MVQMLGGKDTVTSRRSRKASEAGVERSQRRKGGAEVLGEEQAR